MSSLAYYWTEPNMPFAGPTSNVKHFQLARVGKPSFFFYGAVKTHFNISNSSLTHIGHNFLRIEKHKAGS